MAEETLKLDPNSDLMAEVQSAQRTILEIQLGRRAPPPWFERTSFDTAKVKLDGIGTISMVAASAGAMDRYDRADSGSQDESEAEFDAVIESIEEIPEALKLRRKTRVGNKTWDAGAHFKNLWDLAADDKKNAREIAKVLFGGKLYGMLKLAMTWLSKVDVPTMIGSDPEPGGGKDEATARPTA